MLCINQYSFVAIECFLMQSGAKSFATLTKYDFLIKIFLEL